MQNKSDLKRIFVVIAACFVLHGCATIPPIPYSQSAYQDQLTEWVGKDPNALILSWGPPSSTFDMPNGDKMYTWLTEKKSVIVTSAGTSYTYINRYYGPISNLLSGTHSESTSISDENRYWCQTSFVADKSAIIGWVIKGNTCLALDPKNATDAQKKLYFFSSLKPGTHVELTLKDIPGVPLVYEFSSVSNFGEGYVDIFLPSNSIWTNRTEHVAFPDIVSYKISEH